MNSATGKPTKSAEHISVEPTEKVIKQSNSTNSIKGSQVNITIEVLTINLFFDGTKNNKYNIDNKDKYKKKIKKDPKAYESYTNAYSNVAHLYKAAHIANRDKGDVIDIYTEGMGTARDQEDDKKGFALGSGVTGITLRAENAFNKMIGQLQVLSETAAIQRIRINVFGFSRGAATARHFLSKLKGKRNLTVGKSNIRFRVHFVGLFDTVSSFDSRATLEVIGDTSGYIADRIVKFIPVPHPLKLVEFNNGDMHLPEFNNDVGELDLTLDDNKDTHPLKVFHICAKDEYRTFFSLTNIESAANFGYEIYLPGAHSDIGGGYPNGVNEEYRCSYYEYQLSEWLLAEGFYNEEQTETLLPSDDDIGYTTFKRNNIPNDAYMIALKVMYEMAVAEKEGGMAGLFDDAYIQGGAGVCKSSYPTIQGLVSGIPKKVFEKLGQMNGPKLGIFNFSQHYGDLKTFRNQFVHWSAKKEMGYEVRRGLSTKKNAFGDFQQVVADIDLREAAFVGASGLLTLQPSRVVHRG